MSSTYPEPLRKWGEVARLKAWKAKSDKSRNLVFPTAGCNPKLDFLDCLKTCAERAKLDKDNFWLHKFRSTFATRCLWVGGDLRTVQQWLGHSDLESTMRYLNASYSNPSSLNAYSIRVDQVVNSKLNLFGRYDYSPSNLDRRAPSGYSVLSTIESESSSVQTFTVGLNSGSGSGAANHTAAHAAPTLVLTLPSAPKPRNGL